ncbi:hypothetical protein T552_01721 [Pneumocystis carinii B80]|uniref:Uncharacterized protein n=1 Tax=Pneumocystis carinii (strain B80) TaxID=1408658 RepID=A0A0W4ZJB2_PNEC8|nr:hypothetical protein T552_01721 [Pneumocystis carinii B80]KTW28460.1 hypothetical protein T552_01721 [Pneumocystis carinii B80]
MEYEKPLNKEEEKDEILRKDEEETIGCINKDILKNEGEEGSLEEVEGESEEEKLIEEANEYKFKGNELFYQEFFDEAIISYQHALDISPLRAKHERSIYYGNIAECYIRKGLWKEAVEACTNALKEEPEYIKALHRRAKANEKIGTWRSLEAALLDYEDMKKSLLESSPIHKSIKESISRIKPMLSEVQEREKTQMLNKLKDLGNNILGKFGLSTDNFKAVQDPQTGNYSISFQK